MLAKNIQTGGAKGFFRQNYEYESSPLRKDLSVSVSMEEYGW